MKPKETKEIDPEFLFRALGDRTRLRLFHLMGEDEICVCFLVEALGMNQPKISRHLAYLRRAGLVTARRDGKWMHYRLSRPTDPHSSKVLAAVRVWLSQNPEIQTDRSRLVRLCCSATIPAPLKKAPKPASLIQP